VSGRRGSGRDGAAGDGKVMEDVEAEAVLAGKEATDGGTGCVDPAPNLGLERVPLEALVADAEVLDVEAAQGGVDEGVGDGGVDLNAFMAIPGGGNTERNGAEVSDCDVGEEVYMKKNRKERKYI